MIRHRAQRSRLELPGKAMPRRFADYLSERCYGAMHGGMIYLDNNATTPVDAQAVEAMLPFLRESFGNPSSGYAIGREAKKAVAAAREQVAALLGAQPDEIIFTSCGTESDNTAIESAIRAYPERRHLVIAATEHDAVIN